MLCVSIKDERWDINIVVQIDVNTALARSTRADSRISERTLDLIE